MANGVTHRPEPSPTTPTARRNGDGLLNFDEFKRGIRDLGVQLPDAELVSIWQEASSGEGSQPAGVPTFQGPLPGCFYRQRASVAEQNKNKSTRPPPSCFRTCGRAREMKMGRGETHHGQASILAAKPDGIPIAG